MKKIIIMFLIVNIISTFLIATVFAAPSKDPILIRKLNTAFKKIKGWLVKLSLPIAGVAIASGVLVRKFSFRR